MLKRDGAGAGQSARNRGLQGGPVRSDGVLKKNDSRVACSTQWDSLPLLPPGPGGVCEPIVAQGPAIKAGYNTGGEGGIRTHGTLPHTRFPSVLLRPLGHLSGEFSLAQGKGHYLKETRPAVKLLEAAGRRNSSAPPAALAGASRPVSLYGAGEKNPSAGRHTPRPFLRQ